MRNTCAAFVFVLICSMAAMGETNQAVVASVNCGDGDTQKANTKAAFLPFSKSYNLRTGAVHMLDDPIDCCTDCTCQPPCITCADNGNVDDDVLDDLAIIALLF